MALDISQAIQETNSNTKITEEKISTNDGHGLNSSSILHAIDYLLLSEFSFFSKVLIN